MHRTLIGGANDRHSEPSGPRAGQTSSRDRGRLRLVANDGIHQLLTTLLIASNAWKREVGQLKEELRQSRDTGPVDTLNPSAAGLEH